MRAGPRDFVSQTARHMALFRALESARARDRLFEDPFAARFLPWPLRAGLAAARLPPVQRTLERFLDARWPGARSSGVARTRLIDDLVRECVAAGARQVVVLGSGFDCRPRRLPTLATLPVFEVDRPAVLARKRARLLSAGGAAENVVGVPVDFLRDDVLEALARAGLRRGEHTLFLWEGVSNYLDARAVAAVLDLAAGAGGARSRIVFTYVHADVITGRFHTPGLESIFARLAASGEPWTFGIRPAELPALLAEHGLHLVSDVGAAEYRPSVMGERGRDLVGYEFYRVAVAEVAGPA